MKKRILFLLLICVSGLSARADNYRDSLQTMFVLTRSQQMAALSTLFLTPTLDQTFGTSITQIINQFVTSKEHLKMLTDIYEPAFRRHVSEAELDTVLHWCRTSKVQSYNPKAFHEALRSDASKSFAATNIERLKKVPSKARKGKTVQVSPFRVSKSYREAANLCLDKMVVTDTIIYILAPIVLKQVNSFTPAEQTMPEVQAFMRAFIKEWIVLSFSMIFTENDLNYFIQGVDSEAYNHCEEAIQATQALDKLMTMETFAAIASYIHIYHPHLINMFESALNKQ